MGEPVLFFIVIIVDVLETVYYISNMMPSTKQIKAYLGEFEKKLDARFKPLNAEWYNYALGYTSDKIYLEIVLGIKYDHAIAATADLHVCGRIVLTEKLTAMFKYQPPDKSDLRIGGNKYRKVKDFESLLEIMEREYDACLKEYMKIKQTKTLEAIEKLPG